MTYNNVNFNSLLVECQFINRQTPFFLENPKLKENGQSKKPKPILQLLDKTLNLDLYKFKDFALTLTFRLKSIKI